MKIGCFSGDGVSVEQIDLSAIKETVFEIEVVEVLHPRRYPKYKVSSRTIGFSSTQHRAEQLIRDVIVSNKWRREDIYSFIIYERPIDFEFCHHEYMSCWVYDSDGYMIDKRTFPTFWSEGKFDGRTEEEVKFKWGNLVEWCDGQTVSLAFVLASPHLKKYYVNKSEELGRSYYGDDSDDTYLVIDDSYCVYDDNDPCSGFAHGHADALHIYPPHFIIPKNIMAKYQRIWERYLKDLEEYRKYFDAPY